MTGTSMALVNQKAALVHGGIPVITTAMEPTTYAAAIPVDPASAAGLTGRGWLVARVKVTEGRIAVGVLNRSAQAFLAQASLDSQHEIQELRLMIPDLSDIGSVMISNNRSGAPARSVAEVHSVVLKRIRP